jgi:O-Antigen ligase
VKRSAGPLDVLVVAATTLAAFALWSDSDGGYAEIVWYPAGIVLLLLAVMLVWAAPRRRLGGRSVLAGAGLAGYTAWSYLSIIWAGDRGLALTGANRTLIYLLVFTVVIGRRWTGSQAASYVATWAASTVVVGAGTFAAAAFATHPGNSFTGGRLTVPIDYANANAALFLLAAWPLLIVAASSSPPRSARVAALGGAGVAVELALLAQSKGGALATAVTICVLLVATRRRVRMAVPLALVAVAVTAFHGPLFALYDHVGNSARSGAAVRSALVAIAMSFVTLIVAGVVAALVDTRLVRLAPRQARLVNAIVVAVALSVAAAGLAAGVARFGNPASVASRAWHAFKYPSQSSAASTHFVTSAGNHRYDFWRVAAHQVSASPLLGAGADNFATDYLRTRQSSEEPLYPHSLEARLLGGTGIVGFLLFGVFAVAAALLCVRAARSALPGRSLIGAIGVAMFGYWLAHGSVDWLWEFPALSGPVFAAVACAASFDAPPPNAASPARRRLRLAAFAVAALAAAAALVPAWLAARNTSLAVEVWRAHPANAYARLADAARLNRLSDEPYVVAGTVAERRRDWPRAEAFFADALDRNSDNWYSLLEIGIADEMSGKRRAAAAALAAARRLNPRDPILQRVQRDLRAGRVPGVQALDRAMVKRSELSPRR